MAVKETIEFDLDLIDRLIADEEATLEPKHRASIEYRTVAERHVAGGSRRPGRHSPPHAIFIDRGEGSHIWDLDGNEYVDYHLGYGAMVIGHAHPEGRGSDREARAPRDALRAAHRAAPRDRGERRGAVRAPALAVLQLGDRGDARGRPADAGEHRPGPDREDRGDATTATTTR